MKKIIVFISLLLLLFTWGAVAQVTITIPTVQAPAAAGAAVTMPVSVTNFTNVGAITLKITYDTAVVAYTGIANAPAGVTFTVGSGTPGVINLGWFDATGSTPISIASGKLVDLNFTYKRGTSTVGFVNSACDIANGSGTSLTGIVYSNGTLQSTSTTTITIPTVTAPATVGAAVTMPVSVSSFTNVGAITLKITYDPAVMTFTGVANAPTGVTFTVGSGTPGVINLGWFDATGSTPLNITSGKLVDLNFTYGGGSGNVAFTTSACDIANGTGASISGIVYQSGKLQASGGTSGAVLTIPNVATPAAGAAVAVPINVTNFTNVGAITLKITYDTAMVSFTGVANAPTGVTFTVGSGTPGVINLGWFDATGSTPISITSGKLVDLNFTYKRSTGAIGFVASACDIANGLGASLSGVVYNNGSLFAPTVTPTLTMPTVQASAAGSAVTVPITITNFTGIGAITLKIKFDAAVATFTGIANAPTGVTFTVGSGTPGVVNLGWFDATGTTPLNLASGKLVDLNFTYLGGTSAITFDAASDIANSAGVSLTCVYTNGSILLGAPVAPVLQTPEKGALNQPIDVALTWGSVSGAATYRLQVATDSLFTALIVNDSTLTTTSKSLTGLLNSTKYYWRVNTKNTAGTSSYSTVFNFTTIVTNPLVPVLKTPANNATDQPVSLTLTWNAAAGATTYKVQVAKDTLFSSTSLVVNDSTVTTTSKAVSGLLNSTKYYWRVNSTNIAGTSSFSTVFNFTTILAAPAVPVLSLPANNALDQPITVTLTWGAVTGAVTYRVQLSGDANFTAPLVVDDSTVSGTTKKVTPLTLAKQYYWRVNAKNAGGTSAFSSVFNFKVTTTGVEITDEIPRDYSLSQNFPNPFNPTTTIRFGLPSSAPVTMEIYNVLGVKVRTLLRGETMSAGFHQFEWNGKDDAGVSVTSGIYLYRINAGSFQVTKKMMMLK